MAISPGEHPVYRVAKCQYSLPTSPADIICTYIYIYISFCRRTNIVFVPTTTIETRRGTALISVSRGYQHTRTMCTRVATWPNCAYVYTQRERERERERERKAEEREERYKRIALRWSNAHRFRIA